jgi:sugar phosphate isomerase/epimerase
MAFLRCILRTLAILFAVFAPGASPIAGAEDALPRIRVAEDGGGFVSDPGDKAFRPWGVNYDHNENTGGLIEDYWADEWDVLEEDFREIRELGANVVRVHLQTGKFLDSPSEPNRANLDRLSRLLELAGANGLYLDITGLGGYHRHDVPPWFDELPESERWEAQARFWEAVAETCRDSSAVFCYDLMNEPIVPGKPEDDWLAGELGGKHFVQRLTLDPGERSREEIAGAWVERMVSAIRKHDRRHLVTVGVIPWALTFPKAKPFFYGSGIGDKLDFVSVHFYPRKGEVDRALEALAVYQVGKPVVIEETFPLHCSADELERFMDEANAEGLANGWISFYWGKTEEEYKAGEPTIADAIKGAWIRRFREIGPK